jgi:hypothetical protein
VTDFEAFAATVDFGQATANRRGRNPKWPYCPVIDHGAGRHGVTGKEQLLGRAFATRDEAIADAQATIDARRARLARDLADPRYRAVRQQHGFPSELTVTATATVAPEGA